MLILKNIDKSYAISKEEKVFALKKINIKFKEEKFYGIVGHSGSGKSTLIQILGLLDKFDSGEYLIDDVNISNLNEDEKAKLRMKKFGFVFQSFYLNSKLTALENVIVPTLINKKIKPNERKEKAKEMLNIVGLKERINHKTNQLSGGEQQRVAIARALINNPDIIIADEPTGNLDKENEIMIFNILKEMVDKERKTVIVVTHNNIINNYADTIYSIENGTLKLVKKNDN